MNPSRHPVAVRVEVPATTTLQLEVDRRGALVHRGAPLSVAAGPATITWAGAGATADGLYLVAVRDLGTGALIGAPSPVRVDRHAPRIRLAVPALAIPAATRAPLTLAIGDVDRKGIMVRAQIASPLGPRPLGRWLAWSGRGRTQKLLATLRATGAVGPVSVSVEARDGARNVSVSEPAWVDPGAGTTLPLRVVRRVVTAKPWVALTFDDGYSAAAVDSILGTLEHLHARATFCFNAVNAPRWSAALRLRIARAVAQGRLGICSHGYSHRTGRSTSAAFDTSDLRANVVWDRVAGLSSIPFYRPPGGDYGPVLASAARALGYRYLLLWSIDTRDWSGVSSARIVSQVVGDTRAGDIVLEHAIPSSAAALPAIITGLRGRGLEPVRVADLLAAGTPSL